METGYRTFKVDRSDNGDEDVDDIEGDDEHCYDLDAVMGHC